MRKRILTALALLVLVAAGSFAEASGSASAPADRLISAARSYLNKGIAYKRGALGPKAFDCSGFVLTAARSAWGLKLPHGSQEIHDKLMAIGGKVVEKSASYPAKGGGEPNYSKLQPGDFLFFWSGGHIDHVAIYTGKKDGSGRLSMIHAMNVGPDIGIYEKGFSNYWKQTFYCAVRWLPD